jgi:hypothetical protein
VSNAELDAMIEREGLMKSLLILGAILLFGWIIFNDARKPAETFDTSSLVGCYWSPQGLGIRLDRKSLYLLPNNEGPFEYRVSREKYGLTLLPEKTITIRNHDGKFFFRIVDHQQSRWRPHMTLRRFSPEERYTVIDLKKANGFSVINERSGPDMDFHRGRSCGHQGGQAGSRLQ